MVQLGTSLACHLVEILTAHWVRQVISHVIHHFFFDRGRHSVCTTARQSSEHCIAIIDMEMRQGVFNDLILRIFTIPFRHVIHEHMGRFVLLNGSTWMYALKFQMNNTRPADHT